MTFRRPTLFESVKLRISKPTPVPYVTNPIGLFPRLIFIAFPGLWVSFMTCIRFWIIT